ncbi:hypothetical protein [Planomicrobium sp. CPCC 101079]|nr:hypothetical protein [Planomicrobium sp. CPCC 101079]
MFATKCRSDAPNFHASKQRSDAEAEAETGAGAHGYSSGAA